MARGSRRKQRPHKPHLLGPRVYRPKGSRWFKVDMRPWGMARTVMRDPEHPGWPGRGERTELEEVAEAWQPAYHALVKNEHKRRVFLSYGRKDWRLGDAVKAYLEHRARSVEPATVGCDRTAAGHLLRRFGATKRTSALDRDAFQGLADELVDAGYQSTTLGTYVRFWRVFMEWTEFGTCGAALRKAPELRRRIRSWPDPVAGVAIPERGTTDVRTLSDAEIDVVLDAARRVDGQRAGRLKRAPSAVLASGLAMFMGLRQGEIFALRWSDIDRGRRTVRVQWQVPKDSTRLKPLKGKRARTAAVLPGWWDLHRDDGAGFICGRTPDRPISTRPQRDLVTRVLDTAAVNDLGLGWHLFRHTFARLFLEMDGTLEQLQASLGHQSIVTTATIYGHLRGDVAADLAVASFYNGAR